MSFVSVATGEQINLVWPHGFTAIITNGLAELIDPEGRVIAREGDDLQNLGGGSLRNAFFVCSVGSKTYQ